MRNRLLNFFALTAASAFAFAQQTLSIDQAWQYALQNNVNAQKAKIDRVIADQKVKETTGIGFPQVDAQAKYTNNIKIPIVVFGGQAFPMGQKHNVTGGITVSQLLFNGSYLVGLQSAKAYRETAALAEEKTNISVKQGVLMTYAGILATDENLLTLQDNQKVLNKNLEDTKTTYKVGLTEYQNVEQLEYSAKNLETIISNLKRTRTKLEQGLKYLIGFPLDEQLVLTSSFDEIIQKNNVLVNSEFGSFDNHVDYRLKQNQVKINELLLKLEKSKALPTLAAFYSANVNAMGEKLSSLTWNYPMLWGLQLDIPIFSGFQRHWKTEQAKLNLQKANLDLEDTRRNLANQARASYLDYENALASFNNAKALIELSSSIYKKQQIKFKEGMGTSMELSQAESQLYDAQRQYYEAALNLVQSKTNLDEALGTLTADASNGLLQVTNQAIDNANSTQNRIQNDVQNNTRTVPNTSQTPVIPSKKN